MKKSILLMFAYAIIYFGIMFLAQTYYDFSWVHKAEPKNTQENALPVINEQLTEPINDLIKTTSETKLDINSSEAETPQDLTKTAGTKQETEQTQEPAKEPTPQQLPAEEEIKPKPLTLQEKLEANNLVDIETLPVKVFLDMRYATTNNFTGKKLYKKAKCYLKQPAAEALAKAAKYALKAEDPFYLCIYDCYRPKSVQKTMLNSATIPGYLAKVSNHSRGMSVDLGPCDAQGEPFLTPTEFDTFSELSGSYSYAEEIPQIAIENRKALQKVMKKAGFSTIATEWWHFDYKGAKKEEVLDIKF